MKDWEERRELIKAEIGNRPLRVLVVEGPDDKVFIESLLNTRQRGLWESSWIIGEAGGKSSVLRILKDQPTWLALVDKDEWTDVEVAEQQLKFPLRLFVLPRFCMENYHVVPSELWGQLDPARQAAVEGGQSKFEAAILTSLDKWVNHGALWHAVNPLQGSLQALGFKTDLLDFALANSGDAAISAKLKAWHDHLEPNRVMQLYKANLATAQAAAVEERLKRWVHGKRFFSEHVQNLIFGLTRMPQAKTGPTLAKLQANLALPADLQPIWASIGLP